MQVININEIKAILDDEALSSRYIAKETGVRPSVIARYRAGMADKNVVAKSNVLNMRLDTAIKIQELYNKRIEKLTRKEEKKMTTFKVKGFGKNSGDKLGYGISYIEFDISAELDSFLEEIYFEEDIEELLNVAIEKKDVSMTTECVEHSHISGKLDYKGELITTLTVYDLLKATKSCCIEEDEIKKFSDIEFDIEAKFYVTELKPNDYLLELLEKSC